MGDASALEAQLAADLRDLWASRSGLRSRAGREVDLSNPGVAEMLIGWLREDMLDGFTGLQKLADGRSRGKTWTRQESEAAVESVTHTAMLLTTCYKNFLVAHSSN